MLRYLGGVFLYSLIKNEKTLTIFISDDEGTPLIENIPQIINEYNKSITCVCISDKTENKSELIQAIKMFQKARYKICLDSCSEDIAKINPNYLAEVNYLILNKKLLMKDYSPFGDAEDWIEI